MLQFASPQAALGFYASDLEDTNLTLTFVTAEGGRTTIAPPSTVPQGSGGAFYFGFIDVENPFVRVEFSGGSPLEGYGFDDITVAAPEQVRSELQIRTAVELGWLAETGRVYQVQWTPSLPTTQWFNLGAFF